MTVSSRSDSGRDKNASNIPSKSEGRLESWKEIAVYLRREVRTVQRWEKREALPVRRHVHRRGSSVFAWKDEIDQWLRSTSATPIAGEEPVCSVPQMNDASQSGNDSAASRARAGINNLNIILILLERVLVALELQIANSPHLSRHSENVGIDDENQNGNGAMSWTGLQVTKYCE
jgi:hypothetical protein